MDRGNRCTCANRLSVPCWEKLNAMEDHHRMKWSQIRNCTPIFRGLRVQCIMSPLRPQSYPRRALPSDIPLSLAILRGCRKSGLIGSMRLSPTVSHWVPFGRSKFLKVTTLTDFVSFSGIGPTASNRLTHWFKKPYSSSLILLSYSLFYCAHRDLVLGIVGNDDHYFKARHLQLINAALENPETALDDDTIVAVISMAMYEVKCYDVPL